MINFNVPPSTGREALYLQQCIDRQKICGDGGFTKQCNSWLEERTGAAKALLTTSCTHALEMAALLADIGPGDEVIMPSFTFVSTANAFVLRGAVPVFVDIRPDTMNIDEEKIEAAITTRTRAIVPVHYAGVACSMDKINQLAAAYKLWVIEDAAQGVMAEYKGRALGMLGDMGCYSFHETKNYSMGEGGAILLKDGEMGERAEILREKGTDRSRFYRGQVDKYTWVDMGSSYLPSDINASYLYAQLEVAEKINAQRLEIWDDYYKTLSPLAGQGLVELPVIPEDCKHNAHMFYIKCRDLAQRQRLISYLKDRGVMAVFHYIPLHSSPGGLRWGRMSGEDAHTTRESERLLRLPLYYGLEKEQRAYVARQVEAFFASGRGEE